MSDKFYVNSFWSSISSDLFAGDKIKDFNNFKRDINCKISLFDPNKNGIRYLKTLICVLASTMSEYEKKIHSNIHHISVGNPYSILTDSGLTLDLDYYQSIVEASFVSQCFDFFGKNILEIGAGYGRTCHTLMSNFDINSYTIMDLDEMLNLSKSYLKSVLPEDRFAKINFIGIDADVASLKFDLAINIDSFAEMNADVVYNYMEFINHSSDYFYVKNPVGKYLDQTLDNHFRGQEVVQQALAIGILTQILNIDDAKEVSLNAKLFCNAYTPSADWDIVDSSWAKPFSYYWQALYKKRRCGTDVYENRI